MKNVRQFPILVLPCGMARWLSIVSAPLGYRPEGRDPHPTEPVLVPAAAVQYPLSSHSLRPLEYIRGSRWTLALGNDPLTPAAEHGG